MHSYYNHHLLCCHNYKAHTKDHVVCLVSVSRGRHPEPIPGCYYYVTIPNVSFFQSHPLFPIWVDNDRVYFLAQRLKGFSSRIPINSATQSILLDRPYGKSINLEDYGTILLFATEIGIAGILPYLRALLQAYGARRSKTQ